MYNGRQIFGEQMTIPDEVKKLARAQKRIEACWILRRETGLDLTEARLIVDTIAAGGEVQLPSTVPSPKTNETPEQCIRQQIETIGGHGGTATLNKQEIRKLREILRKDEKLLAFTKGNYEQNNGILLVTNKRLLFISREPSDVPSFEEFPLNQIFLVHHKAGQLRPSVKKLTSALAMSPASGNTEATSSIKLFMTEYRRAEFTDMEEDAARSVNTVLSGYVKYRLEDCDSLGPWDELEQWEALWANGAISNEELAEAKRKYQNEIRKESEQRTAPQRRPN